MMKQLPQYQVPASTIYLDQQLLTLAEQACQICGPDLHFHVLSLSY